ncbi:hypothetical protein ACFPIF_15515 [Brevundimonas faecalis]|uniref:hypothetical protein n=1 Tax=Brevundimonas faecalis TaxID=947378 RepID=UPI00360ED765
MAEYLALDRVALTGGVIEPGAKFISDAVPGRHWKPIDKEAKAAVKARDDARKAAEAEDGVLFVGSGGPDPRIAELEAALKDAAELAELRDAEIEELKAQIAKFDRDGDGAPGGSKPRGEAA